MTSLTDLRLTGRRDGLLIFLSETYPFALGPCIDTEFGTFLETRPSLESLKIPYIHRSPISRQLDALSLEAPPKTSDS
jgi:hypothetical protein